LSGQRSVTSQPANALVKVKDSLLIAQENTLSALERMSDEPIYLGNLGYIEFLLGNENKARSLLTKAIKLGGETMRQHTLEDSQIHPVPQDEAFRQLVNALESAE
jgi:hypothetical protein